MFYNDEANVRNYIKMTAHQNQTGELLIERLATHLPENSSVLELGMGPGNDLKRLMKRFQPTGSDNSELFLDYFRKKDPSADLENLDAVQIKTERKFDCIYSNKVLHHLSKDQMIISLSNQLERLNPKGFVLHSFWKGIGSEEKMGLNFVYYTLAEIYQIFHKNFQIIELESYQEMDKKDSFYILAKKYE